MTNRQIIDLAHIYETNLDMFCELIRASVFIKPFGCYSCFDLVEGFKEQDSRRIPLLIRTILAGSYANIPEEIISMRWYKDVDRQLDVYWRWDGDGTLVFQLPDGTIVYNTDCKKDYDWSKDIQWVIDSMASKEYYLC